jgi:hypothetical protein
MSASDQPQYQCVRCQWFDGVASRGLCRKDSPRIIEAGRMAVWPLVVDADYQWCGHFSPKRHAPWTATTTTEGATT